VPSRSHYIQYVCSIFVSPARRMQQPTAPDVSACNYVTRTGKVNTALINPSECLPSKLPNSATFTSQAITGALAHAEMASASCRWQSARTHTDTTHRDSSPQGRLLTGGVGVEKQGLNKTHFGFSSLAPSAGAKPLPVYVAVPRVLAQERGGDGSRFGREGVIVPPPTFPQGSDLRENAVGVKRPYVEGQGSSPLHSATPHAQIEALTAPMLKFEVC
jgi:hypothetical protein